MSEDDEARAHYYTRVHHALSEDEDGDEGSDDDADGAGSRPKWRPCERLPAHRSASATLPCKAKSAPNLFSSAEDPFDILVQRHGAPLAPCLEAPSLLQLASAFQAVHLAGGQAASCDSVDVSATTGQVDFEVLDTVAVERRELLIFAVPLFRDDLVFLPICTWTEEPPDPASFKGQVKERLDALQDSAQGMFDSMKAQEVGTIQNRLFKAGQRVVENQSAVERLMQNIPSNVTKLIIYHPSSVAPDVIMDRLTNMSRRAGATSAGKALLAGLVLPIAFGFDTVIIPGPALMTYYTSFQLYKAAASTMGVRRLTRYIAQDGNAEAVRVNYAGDVRLDPYVELSRESPDGVLSEVDVEDVVRRLREPSLLQPLLELRARQLRHTVHQQDEYALLNSHEA